MRLSRAVELFKNLPHRDSNISRDMTYVDVVSPGLRAELELDFQPTNLLSTSSYNS